MSGRATKEQAAAVAWLSHFEEEVKANQPTIVWDHESLKWCEASVPFEHTGKSYGPGQRMNSPSNLARLWFKANMLKVLDGGESDFGRVMVARRLSSGQIRTTPVAAYSPWATQDKPGWNQYLRVRVLDRANPVLCRFIGLAPVVIGCPDPIEIFLPWPAVVAVHYRVEGQPLLGSEAPALLVLVPQIPEL